jgi:Na+/H+-translocating membrane pyrophosphatase
MAKPDNPQSIDDTLAHVDESRRGFLKGLLLGSAALAALPLMNSNSLAQDQGGAEGKAKGKKGGKGKKGKGGKGKGTGDEGKGKG